MTPREIVRANIECRCEGRIGFNFSGDRLNDFTGAGCAHPFTPEVWSEGGMEYRTDMWGNTWHRIEGMSQGGEVCLAALDDWGKLDTLELPDLDNPAYYAGARDLVAAGADGKFVSGWMPGWPFATCRYMRTMEVYFTDLIAERERIDVLHDRVTTLLEGVIDQYGRAGCDGVFFCEDLGTQNRPLMGPAMWRDIFRPLYERLTSRAHQYGMKVIQHSCGFIWDLMDDLCESGIDCLQLDQPALNDLPALAEKLRRRGVGLFSPCDIQKVLPTGDRQLIEAECEKMVSLFQGGLVAKNYPDLHGIGVEAEWDAWAYETFVRCGGEDQRPSV